MASLLLVIAVTGAGCSPNQRIVESSVSPTPSRNAEPVKSSFESDVQAMLTADFRFIYVFRRNDGAPLDADDRRYAAQEIPSEMNRRTVSDEGKAIIVGSNFKMPPEAIATLTGRFAFEDLSPMGPESQQTPPR